mgnify:CR=1 FL=1
MPSVSRKQQRFFGIVRAAQKGTLESETTPEVQRAAASMKKSDVKKFASTKHKDLPEKKVRKESFNEDYVKELEDGLVKMDYPTYMEVDELMKKIAKENDIDTTTLHMAFKTKHLMVPDDWAKRKMMEPVIIPKTPQIEEKKASKAMDAGARAKRLLLRKEYKAKVSEIIPDELMDSFQINPDAHNKAKRQAKIRNMTKSTNPNEKKVAERKVNDKTQLPKLNTEEQNPEGMKLRDVEKMNRQKKLLAAAKKAPEVKNKIVSANKLREGNLQKEASTVRPTMDQLDKRYEKKRDPKVELIKNIAVAALKPKTTVEEGSLHKWFKGSKSKDGKGGWVNVVTGGTCASDEPGEGTPKCVSSSKRASMTKAERASASRRKKKADPNQQSKSGAAKPTYVSTDTKESYIPEEGYDIARDQGKVKPSKDKKDATTLPVSKEIKKTQKVNKGPSAFERVKKDLQKKGEKIIEAKDLSGKHDKGDKPIKVNLKDLVNKARKNPKNKNLGVKPPTDITEKKVMGKIKKSFKRDEYGDPIKPDGSYAGKLNVDKNPKDEKITHSNSYEPDMNMVEDMSGMSQKSGDKRSTKSGAGMTAAGVAKYNRRTGGNLKTAVTGKVKRGSKAAGRRKSFCARSKGWTGERGKAARRRWKCNNSADYMFELEHGEILNERGPQTLGSGARQSSIHAKKGKKSTKKVSGMIKSLKRKGSVLKQSMGPLDASRKASRLKNLKDDVELKLFNNFMQEGHMNKTCGEGEYYCYQSKKCKKIPKGMKIGYGGMLKPEKDDSEESKGKNGNGNGNGNGHGGNGNGNGNGGGDGGGE